MVTGSNVASILPKWYSVSVRFFVPTETSDCQIFYMTILATSAESAMDVVSAIFGNVCFVPETEAFHSPATGGLLFPWYVDAKEIPDPFSATLHAQMAERLKKVRKKKEKKNSKGGGEVLQLHRKTKKEKVPPEGEPPKDTPPKDPQM